MKKMTKKEKGQFWRISLFSSVLIAIIYVLMYGPLMPSIDKVLLSNAADQVLNPKNIVQIPFAIPRVLDIIFIFGLAALIVRLAQISINLINSETEDRPEKSEAEKTKEKRASDIGFAILTGLAAGTIMGIVGSVAALYANALLLGVVIIIAIGVIVCFLASLFSFEISLFADISYGTMACLIFGLFEIAHISISLSIAFGFITIVFASIGIIFTSIIRLVFTGRI